jgi:hypothetical protein
MNTNQIKLILMNYSKGEYVPELGGIYMLDNTIIPLKEEVIGFIQKYKLNTQLPTLHQNQSHQTNIYIMRKLVFYMNLLNFNGCSSWRLQGNYNYNYMMYRNS